MTTVLSNPNDIERFRRRTILSGLKLESLGMRHSHNSVAQAARKLLTENGIKAPRNKKELYTVYAQWFVKTYP